MIILEDIALRRGQKLLFSGASATLQPGQKIALIGGNGCGKSSLFALLLEELQADAGDIRGLKGLRISHMAQETETSTLTARDYVIAGDAALFRTLQDLASADAAGDYEQSATLHQRMEELDGYSAERRAEQLLLGLGFQREKMDAPMSAFSGGWRIRLNLARALMAPSELMLLDEPTNHLDLDTTLWLQSWLQGYRGTLLMISHDRDFIDATCERTLRSPDKCLPPTAVATLTMSASAPSKWPSSRRNTRSSNAASPTLRILCADSAQRPPRRARRSPGSKSSSACKKWRRHTSTRLSALVFHNPESQRPAADPERWCTRAR
jgi:ATP-binding cassette subfamily F protein 3